MSLRAGAKAFVPSGSKLKAPKKSLNKNAAVFIPSLPPQNDAPVEEEPVLNGVEEEPEPEPEPEPTTTTTTTNSKKTIQYTRDQLLALRSVPPSETDLLRIKAAIHAIMGNIDITSPGRTMPRGGGRSIKRGTGKPTRPGGRKPDSPLMDIEVKELEKTENRYVIKKDVPPDEKLIRDLTSILNKLTPDNFERLLEKIVLLKIDTPARLRDAVDAVFEKALSEPAFSPTYAEFSRHLAQKLPKLTDNGEEIQFKRVLLNKCQLEFEKERSKTSSQDGEEVSAEKRRMLAAIRFIGELYARSMLSSSIIKHCIEILLGDPDSPEEEKIEALCKLLTTSGKVYDEKNPENQAFLDEQFAKLAPLTKKKKGLVSRLRFMIQDLIDLRSHKWVDRRAPTVAQKKLIEIHQEFSKGRAGGAKKPVKPATPAKDADEWETVGKRSKPRNELVSPKARATTSTPRAPSGRVQGNTKTTESALHPSLQRTPLAAGSRNVFEGLDEDDNEGEPDKKKKDKPKKEKESSSKPKKEPVLPKGEKPDPELYERKLSGLFAEYFSNKDLKDAADNVTELKALFEPYAADKKDFGLHLIISKGVFDVMERKKEQQELLAQLLVKIVDDDILSKEHVSDGFTEVLNLAEDMLVDIPKFLDYVGFILGRCLLNSVIDLDYLSSEGTSALTPENRTKLAAIVLTNMKEESAEKLGALYHESEFDFTPLLPNNQSLETFFKAQGLEMLLDGASS